MRFGTKRFLCGAFVAFGVMFAAAASAQAQTGQTTDETSLAAAASTRTMSIYAPKMRVNFQPPSQPQLGPDAGRDDSGIGIGVLAMITRNSLSSDEEFFDFQARTGLGFGLWVGGNRNGTVGFTGEFIFINQKYGDGDAELTRKVLEIPAVFHINFGSRSRNSIGGYAVVGPAFSFKLNESFTGGFGADNFGGVDMGMIVGAGVEVVRIGIEARMNFGLRNIDDSGTQNKIKTRQFELLGKFAFN
jgi:hypothetical protein